MMREVFKTFVALWMFACSDYPSASIDEATTIVFNDISMSIPSSYLLPGLPSSIVPTDELDSSDGISLMVPFRDLGVTEHADLIVLISAPSEYLTEYGVTVDANNAWNGREVYEHRIVENDEVAGLFRVGSEAGSPMFWHYFTASPSDDAQARETWVASCYEAIAGYSICNTQFLFNHVQVELSFPGEEIGNVDELKHGFREMFDSWITKQGAVSPTS
jgi:hypothetical protein